MFQEVKRLLFELLYLNHFPSEPSYLGCVPTSGDVRIEAALFSLTASGAILEHNALLFVRLSAVASVESLHQSGLCYVIRHHAPPSEQRNIFLFHSLRACFSCH